MNDENEKKKKDDDDAYGKFIRKKMDHMSGTPGIDPFKNRSREPDSEWEAKFNRNKG
jgi:hypothetical protein